MSDETKRHAAKPASEFLCRWAVFRNVTAMSWIVFAVALVVFLVQSWHLTRPGYPDMRERSFLLGGDEPWYLLTTRSIALDGDYNLYNDLETHGFEEFYPKDISSYGPERLMRLGHGRTATPDYWVERRYPVRPIGLGIVLAPAYRLGLLWDKQVRLTCVWFLCLVGAFLVQQIFLLGYELTSSRTAAAAGALAGALSMPLIVFVTQIYTELVAAFLLVVAVRMVFTSKWPPLVRALIAGGCIAYLPWLHEKYYPLALVGVVMFLVGSRPWRTRQLVGFGGPLVVSAALLMAYYHSVYGVVYPMYDHEKVVAVSAGIHGGLLGMLFDRTDGLVPFWPVAAFAIAGLAFMFRDRRRVAPWLVALVAMQWLVTGMFEGWTGGRSAPLRHWVPVMPLLIVGSTYALVRIQRLWLVGLMAAAMVFSVVVGARNITHPRALMKDSLPLAPNPGTFGVSFITAFYDVFPDMKVIPGEHEPKASDHVLGLAWLAVTAGFVLLVVRIERGPAKAEAVKQEPSL
jgi:hypothetical protein